MANVVLARLARQPLLDPDWPLIDAVEAALGLLERDPYIGHALRSRLNALRSLRVGPYRIIYQLATNDRTVRVAAIRHRSIAYLKAAGLGRWAHARDHADVILQ